MDLEIDTQEQGWGPVLVKDSRDLPLDRLRIMERLLLAELSWIYLEWKFDKRVAAPLLQSYLYGFKGYDNYTDQELVDEWHKVEASFFKAHDAGDLLYPPPPFDPLHAWARAQPKTVDAEIVVDPAAS